MTKIIQCGPGKVDREIARDAIDFVEIVQRRSLAPVLEQLKEDGYSRVGLEQTTHSVCLYDFAFEIKTALIIGAERDGLSQEELDRLDHVVEMPDHGCLRILPSISMIDYAFISSAINLPLDEIG